MQAPEKQRQEFGTWVRTFMTSNEILLFMCINCKQWWRGLVHSIVTSCGVMGLEAESSQGTYM
jgi:hypothetical protein